MTNPSRFATAAAAVLSLAALAPATASATLNRGTGAINAACSGQRPTK